MFSFFPTFIRRLKKIFTLILKHKRDAIFVIESIIIGHLNKWLKLHPSSEPYLSGDTYRKMSSAVFKPEKGFDIQLNRCDILFLSLEDVEVFSDNIASLNMEIIVISHHSDKSFDSKYLNLLENKNILHWYAQNTCFSHKKLTAIPIGLEDAWRYNNGVVRDFKKIVNHTCGSQKKSRVLFGFSIETNPQERALANDILMRSRVADHINKPARAYRKILEQYMFVASPPGNGIDCHRTWEALYVNCIPVVLKGSVNENFPNLPVLYLDKWEDILDFTECQLKAEYDKIIRKIPDCEILWASYWRKEFKYRRSICGNGK